MFNDSITNSASVLSARTTKRAFLAIARRQSNRSVQREVTVDLPFAYLLDEGQPLLMLGLRLALVDVLSARIAFSVSTAPDSVRVVFEQTDAASQATPFRVGKAGADTIALLGLKASTSYSYQVEAFTGGVERSSSTSAFMTAELPEDLARLAGYRRGAYALGYYGDLHDPFDAVRGESSDGPATFSPVPRRWVCSRNGEPRRSSIPHRSMSPAGQ